jgi:hypothetical protein
LLELVGQYLLLLFIALRDFMAWSLIILSLDIPLLYVMGYESVREGLKNPPPKAVIGPPP